MPGVMLETWLERLIPMHNFHGFFVSSFRHTSFEGRGGLKHAALSSDTAWEKNNVSDGRGRASTFVFHPWRSIKFMKQVRMNVSIPPTPLNPNPEWGKKKKTANTWHIQRHEKQCFLHVVPHRKEENQTSSKLCQQISASIQITSQTKNIWPQFLYAFHLVFFNDNCPQPFCKTLLLPTFRSCTCTKLAWNFPLSQAKDFGRPATVLCSVSGHSFDFQHDTLLRAAFASMGFATFCPDCRPAFARAFFWFFCYLWWRLDIFFCFLFWALWSKNLKHVRDFSFSQASEKSMYDVATALLEIEGSTKLRQASALSPIFPGVMALLQLKSNTRVLDSSARLYAMQTSCQHPDIWHKLSSI